jgi:hypothetical protein
MKRNARATLAQSFALLEQRGKIGGTKGNRARIVTVRLHHWAAVRHGLTLKVGAGCHAQGHGGIDEALALALV